MSNGPKPTGQKKFPDDEAQSKRFIEAAKEAGADETAEGADRAFRRIGRAKPEEAKPSKAK